MKRMLTALMILIGISVIGCNQTNLLPSGAVREFVLIIKDMRFIGESPLAIANTENPDLVAHVGDRVKITLKNKESQLILHDFKISNHDVSLSHYLRPNESATVEFTTPRAGEFTYYDPLNPNIKGRFLVLNR